tara:strand:- start:2654 stop:3337 length:684 start_codon:yes stop_codon:yes gene_type:complete
MYRELIVVSPCICRSEIHIETFPILLDMLSRDKQVIQNTRFLINIDPCSGTNGETQEQTEQNFIDMFKRYDFKKYEITKGDKGCFFTAAKTLLQRTEQLIDTNSHSAVLWFEDDKRLRKDPVFEGYMKETEDYVIHLWKKAPQAPSFHPCLWSANMAKKYLIQSITTQTTPYDPELLMMNDWRKRFHDDCRFVHYFFSDDIGREWQKKNGIKKWVRENTLNKSVTYV